MSSLAEARRFRDTLDHVSDYIFMKDSEYRYVYANKHTLKLFGCTAQDLLGKDDSSFFDPASLERVRQGDSRAMAGEEVNEEIDLNLPGGRRVVYREAKVPIYESAGIGEITGLLGIASDITAQKELEESLRQALAENKALLQELQHRVKNSFNMIAGLISLSTTKDMSEYTRSALAELGTRVGSVSELYSFLYSMGNFTELRLDEYCQRVGTSLLSLSTTILLDFDMESLVVSAKLAAPVGLILTELITNSLKYAFRDGRRGSITIGLKRGADGAVLSVRDGGAGLPSGFDPSSSTGLGLRLVRGLCGQIQGHFEMSADAGGTVCVLEFPIEGGPGGS